MVAIVSEALKPVAPKTSRPFVFATDEALSHITASRRFNAGLIGVLIAAAGVYAVMASFVAQQTREIGVRLALGATPARIQHGVLALAWRHVLAGLVIGLPLAWWLSRGFTALLFQVTPADPSVYLGVASLVGVIGLVAAWAPARRAARVDPIISLKG
jgi:putative ABC transport system permease protein